MMNLYNKGNVLLGTVAAGILAAWSANADTQLGITYDTTYNGDINLAALGSQSGEDAYLTAFNATYKSGDALPVGTSNPFNTFCVDIAPYLVTPGYWQAKTFPSSTGGNGNTIPYVANGIQRAASLYNAYISKVDTTTASGELYGAALQLAIWNALYDTDSTVSSGAFNVSGGNATSKLNGTSTDPVDLANQMLTSTSINPNLNSTFWDATNPSNNQDLIGPQFETGFVPEPGAYAAAASTCAFLGLLVVRKKQKIS